MIEECGRAEMPGLIAAAVYLRPARRAEALATLVDLGMFIREYQGHATNQHSVEFADILVMFVDEQLEHLRAVDHAVSAGKLTIVMLPPMVWTEPFEKSGAFAVMSEAAERHALRKAFADAGQVARQRRVEVPRVEFESLTTIFGGLEFRPDEPWLAREGNLAGLSPTEHGVLKALVTARGAVVPKDFLQRQLSASDEPASDGYLKTVVLRLRRKVEQLGGDPARLSAVRGAGYVLRG